MDSRPTLFSTSVFFLNIYPARELHFKFVSGGHLTFGSFDLWIDALLLRRAKKECPYFVLESAFLQDPLIGQS